MTDIPLASQFNDPATTEGQFKRAFSTLLTALSEIKKITDLVNSGLPTTKVINSLGVTQDTLNQHYADAIANMVKLTDLTTALNKKADTANTAAGYGITDVLTADKSYSRDQVNDLIKTLTLNIQGANVLPTLVNAYPNLDTLKASTGVDGRVSYVASLGWYRYDGVNQLWKPQVSNSASIDSGVGGQLLGDFNNAMAIALGNKADKATTLAGYGIKDTYTKEQVDTVLATKLSLTDVSQKFEPLISNIGNLGTNPTWNPVSTVGNAALASTVTALAGRTDWLKQKTVTILGSLTQLNALTDMVDGQSYFVSGEGIFKYVLTTKTWVKQQGFNDYDFKNQQPIQYYFDILGNWDDAIFQAQLNIYLRGFSPKLLLPSGTIDIAKPIVGGIALALKVHEYLSKNAIEYDFYNSNTNSFKKNVWGQEFVSTRGCTLNWVGSTIGTDKTWRDWAIFHIGCPPTRMDWMVSEDVSPKVDDHVKIVNILIFGGGAFVHGVFIQRQSFTNLHFCQILSCLGAGIMVDRTYDSVYNKVTVLHCGRMVGDTERDGFEKNYGVEKQLYAPIHVTRSSGDNSNYIVFRDAHLENNDNCIADIIVTGDSSPVIFDTVHFECGYSDKYSKNLKRLFRIGTESGAECFAVENLPSYDPNKPLLNNGGGYVLADHINGTTSGYQYGVNLSNYGQIYISDSSLPNGISNVLINTSNGPAMFEAVHCAIGNIEINGGNSRLYPIKIYNSQVGNITGSYLQSMILNDVVCGDIALSNLYTNNSRANPLSFRNVAATQLSVVNGNLLAVGDIALTSNDNPSVTLEPGSDLKITYSGYMVNNFVEY